MQMNVVWPSNNLSQLKTAKQTYRRALKLQKKQKQKPVDSFAHNMNNIE